MVSKCMKSNLDVLREMIQTATVDELIDCFGGDSPENMLCNLITGEYVGCRSGNTKICCSDCIKRYLLAPAEEQK